MFEQVKTKLWQRRRGLACRRGICCEFTIEKIAVPMIIFFSLLWPRIWDMSQQAVGLAEDKNYYPIAEEMSGRLGVEMLMDETSAARAAHPCAALHCEV